MKKYLNTLIVIFILIVIGLFTANYWIKNKIENQLKQEETLEYEGFSFNILNGNINLETAKFSDKKREIQSKELDVNFDLMAYLIDKTLKFNKISAESLDVVWKKTQTSSKSDKPEDVIIIQKIDIQNANFQYQDEDKTLFSLKNINLFAEDITWPMKDEMAWVNSVEMTSGPLSFEMNNLHDLKLEALNISEGNIEISKFQIEPKYTKSNYIEEISTEKDWMDLTTETIEINNFSVEKTDSNNNYSIKNILISNSDFVIYRDKTIADDKSIKPLYSESLRSLDFDLNIDSIQVGNLDITYQELVNKGANPAEIKFNKIDASIVNIHNYEQEEVELITTKASAEFSESSAIYFNYSFDPMDKNDEFSVDTKVVNVLDSSVNSFFAPALSMKLDGKIDDLSSKMKSQNTSASGTFQMAYEKLKIKVLSKDGSERSFASLLSNVFVKNKDVDVEHNIEHLERDQTKSFWNYVWKFIQSGIKKTLL